MNIENIYASQIVEEIRREREKAQQNVSLKKLYRISVNNQRIMITKSKVIDEMYANQAKQYTGESSLDHEENNDEENDIYRR